MTAFADRQQISDHHQPTTSPSGLARIPHQADHAATCRRCGATAATAISRITGTWSVVDERPVWACDTCTRALLPEIEALGRASW